MEASCQHGMENGIIKSQGLQVPTTVFVLLISTQSLVKHQIVINPVRLTKYLTITIVIFGNITILILIYYHDISNYLYYLPALLNICVHFFNAAFAYTLEMTGLNLHILEKFTCFLQ